MIDFLQYLNESAGKLTHLEHLEDYLIHNGKKGLEHAKSTISQVHSAIKGEKVRGLKLSTKWDGSPSVVYGHHPETGKFFVASKSAFNKTPKINYSHEDVDRNHGHAPGLASKLKAALTHLPKIAPKSGVYQGDFLYHKHDGDVKSTDTHHSFTPNTITYSVPKHSEEGKKIDSAHIGFVTHTQYKGKDFASMHAGPLSSHTGFHSHEDVHHVSPFGVQSGHVDHQGIAHAVHAAEHAYKGVNRKAVTPIKQHLLTYINSTVRSSDHNATPSVHGLLSHIQSKADKEIGSVKTPKAKAAKTASWQKTVNHIHKHASSLGSLFAAHSHIQTAKNHLVNALSGGSSYGHHVGSTSTKPEGFVVTNRHGKMSKLVDRHEFSRNNFQASANRK